MKRPLEEGDVAEHLRQLRGGRIALQAAAVLGQHDERKIRPGRLLGNPAGERTRVDTAQRLLGDHGDVGTAAHLLDQLGEVDADIGMKLGVAQKISWRPPRRGRAAQGSKRA